MKTSRLTINVDKSVREILGQITRKASVKAGLFWLFEIVLLLKLLLFSDGCFPDGIKLSVIRTDINGAICINNR